MKFKFLPIDYDYFDFNGRNYVRMIGRDEKGMKICVVDQYEANFWLILNKDANAEKIVKQISGTESSKSSRTSKILRTEITNKKFLGKDVKAIKVYVSNHKDAHDIASEIGDIDGICKRREYDISLITKYIKEKNVEPLKWYDIGGNDVDGLEIGKSGIGEIDVDQCILAESIKLSEKQEKFTPRILAYDIETTGREIGTGEILMISLYGKELRKVLTWKKHDNSEDYVEMFDSEADMLEKFAEYVREYGADILTGYFSDGFDLPYLRARAEKNKVKLILGVDGRAPNFGGGRIPAGKIAGVVHVDLYRFISSVFSQYLQSETLSLNEVAKELIGEAKEDFDFKRLDNMKNSDWADFCSYNLQDAVVTYKLAEKLWSDISEFCKIIKEPIFNVTRDSMATHVENHILHNLDRFDEIAEKRPGYDESNERKTKGKFEGAFVFEPKPGFYKNLVMFDFTSMHASIIVSFNISMSTLRKEGTENTYVSPEFDLNGKKTNVCFDKKAGFFSILLAEVVEKRKKYKKEYSKDKNAMTKARSNAYKLLANASFGYQGFFGARYYSREAAAATLAFVRKFTEDTIGKIRDEGFEIIYSDTDSIAFLQKNKSKEDILKFLEKLNSELPGIMELDLEDFYPRGLFVAKRGTNIGAKKKYALLDEEGRIKIRGFETVRRDWCQLTRKLQSEILIKILEDGNEKSSLTLLKNIIEKLKNREIDKSDLTIRTQLKRPLDEYVSEGPHVVAAKKMKEKGSHIELGMVIEYYIGESRGKLVRDKVFLSDDNVKYNIDYYLNTQILPAVENIFDVFGVDVRAIIVGEKQKKLF